MTGRLRPAVLLLAAALAAGQQAEVPPPPPKLALPLRVGVFGQTPLRLEEAIAMAVENNPDIRVARLNARIAILNVTVARGVYDPVFSMAPSWQRIVTPTASVILGGEDGKLTETELFADPQVTWRAPWLGATYSLAFSSSRLTTNNEFVLLNPQYPTQLLFTFVQPLLRGLRFDEARSQIEVSRQNAALSQEQFRQTVMDAVTAAVESYYELLYARRNLELQLAAVELARRQVESNRRMAEQGLLANIGVIEAWTQLATFEEGAWLAQELVTTTENQLKQLMLPDRGSPLWHTELVPVSEPRTGGGPLALDEAVAEALANRPEVRELGITARINEIETRLAREAVRPQVDLFATLGASGLAGQRVERVDAPIFGNTALILGRLNELSLLAGLPPLPEEPDRAREVPEVFSGGYFRSLRNLYGLNYPTLAAGFQISVPLFNRGAKANLAASRVAGQRIAVERERAEQAIEAEVRNAIQSVVTARGVLDAARTARRLAEEQYESESRLFRAGLSTVFLVLQRQSDMVTARRRALRAEIDLVRSIARLDAATGRTLDAHGVVVEQVR
jgi:outer membrane protein TolC